MGAEEERVELVLYAGAVAGGGVISACSAFKIVCGILGCVSKLGCSLVEEGVDGVWVRGDWWWDIDAVLP